MKHNCPHGNRDCSPESLCTPCGRGKGVLRDGELVRVPTLLMDSAQRALHDRLHGNQRPAIPDEVRIQARVDHALHCAQQDGAPELDPRTRELLDGKGRQVATQLQEIADGSARVEAFADHFRDQAAARDAAARTNARDAAYSASVDALQRRGW